MATPLSENWTPTPAWANAQPDNDFNRRMDALEARLRDNATTEEIAQARGFSGYDPDAVPDLEDGYGN